MGLGKATANTCLHLSVLLLYPLSYCCKQQAGFEPATRRSKVEVTRIYGTFPISLKFKELQATRDGGLL